jgi:hypothetical protein
MYHGLHRFWAYANIKLIPSNYSAGGLECLMLQKDASKNFEIFF